MIKGLKGKMVRLLNDAIRPFGARIVNLKSDLSMRSALGNIRKRGYAPTTIIDVGASNGKWSQLAYSFFPNAHYLLFEPVAEAKSAIVELIEKYEKWHYCDKVAGNEIGNVKFNVSENPDGSGVAFDGQSADNVQILEMVTVDSECERLKLPSPYLVKLDTHGFEIPVLNGMTDIWDETDFLIIESYNFKLHEACLRFFELAAYLEEKGFLTLDIVDVMRRPGDFVTWQMDIVFAKRDHKEFGRTTYSF